MSNDDFKNKTNTNYAISRMAESFDATIDFLKDYTKIIGDLQVKLSLFEKYLSDSEKNISTLLDNTFSILNKMNRTSNEDIENILVTIKNVQGVENSLIEKIRDDMSCIQDNRDSLKDLTTIIAQIKEDTASSRKLYKVITGVLIVLNILVGGFEIIKTSINIDKQDKADKLIEEVKKLYESQKIENMKGIRK
jgi:cysteinyl-tRNA synthetase